MRSFDAVGDQDGDDDTRRRQADLLRLSQNRVLLDAIAEAQADEADRVAALQTASSDDQRRRLEAEFRLARAAANAKIINLVAEHEVALAAAVRDSA